MTLHYMAELGIERILEHSAAERAAWSDYQASPLSEHAVARERWIIAAQTVAVAVDGFREELAALLVKPQRAGEAA